MFRPKIRFTHDEIRVLVFALNELRNTLIAEGRYSQLTMLNRSHQKSNVTLFLYSVSYNHPYKPPSTSINSRIRSLGTTQWLSQTA